MLSNHLDKDNLHHAYLIEGNRDEIVPEITEFLKDMGIETLGNPDFTHIELDSFKIEDARNLKSYGIEKGFSSEKNAKKIFIISANNFLLEAQNSLLKMFEEPIENTHFFLITPDANALLKTLVSRFYFIKSKSEGDNFVDAEKFINMSLSKRIDFLKELLAESEEEIENSSDSPRTKALQFLNTLELTLYQKTVSKGTRDTKFFEHIFKVREFLRIPGSSAKTLMESVALIVPNM